MKPLHLIDAIGLVFFLSIFIAGNYFVFARYRKRIWFQQHGVLTKGTIICLEKDERDSDSVSLVPVVQYVDANNELLTVRYDIGAYPSPFHVGQPIHILYNPNDSRSFIIGKESFGLLDWLAWLGYVLFVSCVLYMVFLSKSVFGNLKRTSC
ncbi:DUF3592 domain-containing protein [Hymenobacter sp. J193]|uniref:DUF3592 domain-containing protein n=1 Tax=Hymenobacter sp. J193 TaxID=2898429 RepID=UPI002151359D|nr:DUF3592 domain-containing protein [Hymenobacter sp. J193]MCR5886617.1 DUF3592 domain-containing protein [Hymenobacter sp. J193]